MTENECNVLAALGPLAWLYRVDLSASNDGEIVLKLKDPIATLDSARFRTAVWRIDLGGLEAEAGP